MRGRADDNAGFRCVRCEVQIPVDPALAGVNHRNHCPYCLWSRHLDLYSAGDRLSACKALMEPIGLTSKRRRKKYRAGAGELMLVHRCTGCGALSINRIAADDVGEQVLEAFERSAALAGPARVRIAADGIDLLDEGSRAAVRRQLYGERV